MPDQRATEAFLRERVAAAVAPRTNFAIGSVEDDVYCLVRQDEVWVVGTGERGRFHPKASFQNEVEAARYLIVLLLGGTNKSFTFPAVDWTGYASLPGEGSPARGAGLATVK